MKLQIVITDEGLEQLAKGNSLYNWHFSVRTTEDMPPTGLTLVGNAEIELPNQPDCAKAAIEYLQRKMKDVRAEAYQEVVSLESRISDLQLIGYTAPEEVEDE